VRDVTETQFWEKPDTQYQSRAAAMQEFGDGVAMPLAMIVCDNDAASAGAAWSTIAKLKLVKLDTQIDRGETAKRFSCQRNIAEQRFPG
jgi:hypothetical protein